jgi:nucleotide-binding universal stress UspA family protein
MTFGRMKTAVSKRGKGNAMNERMKILIAYDGSDCAEAALKDLQRAGLPKMAEAVALSVADVFVPPPINEEVDNTFPLYVPAGVRRAHERAAQALDEARGLAERAAKRIAEMFPEWDVRPESEADSPAWAVVKKAWEWKPDLVVVGAHGHTVLGGRLILGSVSQRALYEARCTVRVARDRVRTDDSPLRLIIGTDGSPDADAAVESVAARSWPSGTEARLVAALDTVLPLSPDPSSPAIVKWLEADDAEDMALARKIFEASADKLRAAGVNATTVIKKGAPKHLLLDEAEEWNADCVFVGAKGLRGIERFLLGSVSSAVAARANCSVEVVRRKSAAE